MSEQVAQTGANATLIPVGRNTRMYQTSQGMCHFGETGVYGLLIKWILKKWNKNA
jgi:hypothetical protein